MRPTLPAGIHLVKIPFTSHCLPAGLLRHPGDPVRREDPETHFAMMMDA
jgi:hypothetical protein